MIRLRAVLLRNDLPKVARLFGAAFPRHMVPVVSSVAAQVSEELAELSPYDTGAYAGAWGDTAVDLLSGSTSDYVDVYIEGETVTAEVFNAMDYGIYVELGTSTQPGANLIPPAVERAMIDFARDPSAYGLDEAVTDAWEEST